MENQKTVEKTLTLSELFYAIKKSIALEILIFFVVTIIGCCYAVTRPTYYTATANLTVKANFQDGNINNTSLSKMLIPTIKDVIQNDIKKRIVEDGGAEYTGAIAVGYQDDSLSISISYKDLHKETASAGLNAIISSLQNYCQEIDEEKTEAQGTTVYKHFAIDVNVVQNLKELPEPVASSNKVKLIAISALLGVVCAVVFAVLLYFMMDKITTVSRLEAVTGKKNFTSVHKKKLTEEDVNSSFLKLDIKRLADTLVYMQSGDDKKVYQIQSALSGEGKTTITVNLALALGKSQRRVLVIDCDFSKPSIHRIFNLQKEIGITDYFKNDLKLEDIVKHTGEENVDLLTCGELITNHTIFFASKKFTKLVLEAKKKYDIVLIDCAPIRELSDYIHISGNVDATMLVVRSNRVTSRDVEYSIKELELCNGKFIGTVFNFSEEKSRRNYYYYYYRH